MKKLLFLFSLISLLFISCVSTEVVDPMEVGLRPSEVNGVVIKVSTQGTMFAGSELKNIAKEADKQGYKYFVILSKEGGYDDTGYIFTQYGLSKKTTYNTVTKAFLFNDEEELNLWLDSGVSVYKTENYLK